MLVLLSSVMLLSFSTPLVSRVAESERIVPPATPKAMPPLPVVIRPRLSAPMVWAPISLLAKTDPLPVTVTEVMDADSAMFEIAVGSVTPAFTPASIALSVNPAELIVPILPAEVMVELVVSPVTVR